MPLLSVACLACLCVQPLCCPSRDAEQAGWSPQDSAALPVAACFPSSSSEQPGSLVYIFSALQLKKQKTIVVKWLKRNLQEQAEQSAPSPPLDDPQGPLADLLFGFLFCSLDWGCASPSRGRSSTFNNQLSLSFCLVPEFLPHLPWVLPLFSRKGREGSTLPVSDTGLCLTGAQSPGETRAREPCADSSA